VLVGAQLRMLLAAPVTGVTRSQESLERERESERAAAVTRETRRQASLEEPRAFEAEILGPPLEQHLALELGLIGGLFAARRF
jgi:hypothetical protein